MTLQVHKFLMKIFDICDSKTNLILKFDLVSVKQKPGQQGQRWEGTVTR